jgi:hypothetical protein
LWGSAMPCHLPRATVWGRHSCRRAGFRAGFSLLFPALLVISAATMLAQPPANQPCRIAGQVLSATTGAPLKNATLRLEMHGHVPPGHTVTDPDAYESSSDVEGRFLFDAIPSARYLLTGDRIGYISQNYQGVLNCAEFTDGKKELVIKLAPQGMISGHVIDEDGDPVPGANIEVLRRVYINGSRRFDVVDGEPTHADGGFAIGGLKPGRYYVRASHRKEEEDPAEPGRRGAIKEAFITTFFPAAFEVASATPIDVIAGAQIPGIDIRLKKSRAFRVSGKLVPASKEVEVILTQQDGPPAKPSAETENGRFEFRDILPGTYVLQPDDGGRPLALVGSATVTVRDEDLRDVTLTLGPPLQVKATVTIEGGDPHTLRTQSMFVFYSESGPSPGRNWRVDGEGKFVAELAPGRYRVELLPLGFLKSIRLNGQEVTAGKIDLTAAGTLDLVVSMNVAQVNVVTRDADGQPVPNAVTQMCDAHNGCTTSRMWLGLAPGEYRACAWADEGDGIITVPEFRARFEGQCAQVKLEEKSHETVELKLITKEAMDAEAAKIP